jgi:RNA polymerase sigma-70 factor (ECF subfamily)
MVIQPQRNPTSLTYKPAVVLLDAEQADAELVEQARNGHRDVREAAFAVLVTRYEGFVRAMLNRLCNNSAEADELAQEAFLTAWLKLNTLQQPARFRGWLKQLAYRQFLHGYRRQKVEQKYAALLPEEAREEPSIELETDDDLEPLLALCSPLERELMVLCYAFEFTHAEIAASRNMAVGTIKSHVHRAKQKMKLYIEQTESLLSGVNSHG